MTNRITRQALALGLTALWLAVPAAEAQYEEAWVAQYNGPPDHWLAPFGLGNRSGGA